MRLNDLTGQKFGRLTVIERADYADKTGKVYWKCLCDCGNEKIANGARLKSGQCKSCGCYLHEFKRGNDKYNGLSKTRAYVAWLNIKNRCYDDKNAHYENYGGRGIVMCDEWNNPQNGFLNFYNWSINNGYQENLNGNECSIDRIDNDGNYEPQNCRWVNRTVQQNNTRKNRLITINGETHTFSEWSRIQGIKKATLYYRLEHGWSIEKTFGFE